MFSLILSFIISLFILLFWVFIYKKWYSSLGVIVSLFSWVVLFLSFYIILSWNQDTQKEIVKTNVTIPKEVEETIKTLSSYADSEIVKLSACEVLETNDKKAICIKDEGFDEQSTTTYSEKYNKCLTKHVYRYINETKVYEKDFEYVKRSLQSDCESEKKERDLLNEFN